MMSQSRSEELKSARQEVSAAEKKVAEGIKKIHELGIQKLNKESKEYQSSVSQYDSQGVAKVELTSDELKEAKLDSYFPEGLDQGISILLFKGPLTHPPIQYMVQQKIRLLCRTAETDFGIKNIDAIQKILFEKLSKDMNNLNPSDEDFHDKSKKLMNQYIGETCAALYQNLDKRSDIPKIFQDVYPNKDPSKISIEKQFVKSLNKKSTHHRSSEMAILTFNETTNKFSFDVSPKTDKIITAHDREIGNGTANLTTVWEGTTSGENYQVTSQLVKHGSPAPLDAIKAGKDPIDILIDTYQNFKEITSTIAANRLHGRNNDNKSINIDLNYHLLTSNRLNQEKQRQSYKYTASAAQLMSGVAYEQNGIQITPQVHVMNIGINILTGNNPASKTVRFENRKTYIHLSDALQAATPLTECSENLKNALGKEEFTTFSDTIAPLSDLNNKKADEKVQKEIKQAEVIQNQMKENNITFKLACDYYLSEKEKLATAQNQLKDEKDQDKIAALNSLIQHKKELLTDARKDIQQCMDANKELRKELGKLHKIILLARKNFFKDPLYVQNSNIQKSIQFLMENREDKNGTIQKLSNIINDPKADPLLKKEAEDYAASLLAHVCKAYMDKLYYSKQIRDPDKAALFHSYSMMYEHLLGLSSNTGCKSANDRTYIVRLFVAHLQGQPLDQVSIPDDLSDDVNFHIMIDALNQDAMTNSAMISPMHDSGGGTPKAGTGVAAATRKLTLKESWQRTKQKAIEVINTSVFKWLKGIKGLQESFKFGNYAPHKLAKDSKLIKKVSKNLLSTKELELQNALKKFKEVSKKWKDISVSRLAILREKKRIWTEDDIIEEQEKIDQSRIEETKESVKVLNLAMVSYLTENNINTTELPYYIDQKQLIESLSFQLDEAKKLDTDKVPEDIFKNEGFLARLLFGEGTLDYQDQKEIYSQNGQMFFNKLLSQAFPDDGSVVPLFTMKLLLHVYSYLHSVDPNLHPEVEGMKKILDEKLKANWNTMKGDWDEVIATKYKGDNSISAKMDKHIMAHTVKKPSYLRNALISRLVLAEKIPDWIGKEELIKFFIIHPEHFAASMSKMSEENINYIRDKIGEFKDIESNLYHQLREWSIKNSDSSDPNEIFKIVNKKIHDWNNVFQQAMKLPQNKNEETLNKLESFQIKPSNLDNGMVIELVHYFLPNEVTSDPLENQRKIYFKIREWMIDQEIHPDEITKVSNLAIEQWNIKHPNSLIPLISNERGQVFEIEKTMNGEITSEKIYEKTREWELLNDPFASIESPSIAAQSNAIIDELKETSPSGHYEPISIDESEIFEDQLREKQWDKMTNAWNDKITETSLEKGIDYFHKESSEQKSEYSASLFQMLSNFNKPLPAWVRKHDLVMLVILHPGQLVVALKNGDPNTIKRFGDLNKLSTSIYEEMRELSLSSDPSTKIIPHHLTKSVNTTIDQWNAQIEKTYGDGEAAKKYKIPTLDFKTSIMIELKHFLLNEENLPLSAKDIYLKIREHLLMNPDAKTTPEERLNLVNDCIKSYIKTPINPLTLDDVTKIESEIELEQTNQIKELTAKIENIDHKLEMLSPKEPKIEKPLEKAAEPIKESESHQEVTKEPTPPPIKQFSFFEWLFNLLGWSKETEPKLDAAPSSIYEPELSTPAAEPPATSQVAKLNSLSATAQIMSITGIPKEAQPIPDLDPELSETINNWVAKTQQTLKEIKENLNKPSLLNQLNIDSNKEHMEKLTEIEHKRLENIDKKISLIEKHIIEFPEAIKTNEKIEELAKEIEATKKVITSFKTEPLPEKEIESKAIEANETTSDSSNRLSR